MGVGWVIGQWCREPHCVPKSHTRETSESRDHSRSAWLAWFSSLSPLQSEGWEVSNLKSGNHL